MTSNRTQIPSLTPQTPPGVTDLIGKFDALWYVVVVAGVLTLAYGIILLRGQFRYSQHPVSPALGISAGGAAVVVGTALLMYGT